MKHTKTPTSAAADGNATANKRKQRSSSSDAEFSTSQNDNTTTAPAQTESATDATSAPATMYDDAGSSRLFQPHRSLGLLTAAYPKPTSAVPSSAHHSPSAKLFQSKKGEFHLQPQATSSEETFVTVPLGERFQILTLSKLVPVLVSRALPPSADHHRGSSGTSTTKLSSAGAGGTNAQDGYRGGDEEEMHQAVSDSSLSVTVATHGPKVCGRAVSITMYSRTRPLVCLDAFSFLDSSSGRKKKRGQKKWGIVDMIPLGKQRVVMSGEKDGKMENTLLFAIVCAKDDAVSADGTNSSKGNEGDAVMVVGDDSDEDSEESASDDESESTIASDDDSTSDDDDQSSGEDSTSSMKDEDKIPPANCHGRILLVQASRTSMKIIKTIDLSGDKGSKFIPYVGLHPATYVNKILVGGRATATGNGDKGTKKASMLLVNVRSGKVIHSFQCLSKEEEHEKTSIITTFSQSPAVDTIAVGTSDGSVHLVNTLHDVKLFSLHHTSKALAKKDATSNNAVSSISFRTDGNATRQGVAPLAVGTDDGSVSVWDLTPVQDEDGNATQHRTLLTQMEGVHHGGISRISYLPGEPLLLSTGLSSNSILMHVFDAPDHSGRILRQRKGHTSPPQLLRYLHPGASGGGILANAADGTDASSCQILSCGGAGDLTLRLFSTARSNLDKEYSQGRGLDKRAKKLFGAAKAGPEGRAELLLPEIVGLSTSEVRGRDWGDLVTIHRNHAHAYVWSTKRGAQSGPVLRQPHWNISAMKDRPPRGANATSLAISACGSFAVVGTLGGVAYKYNIQSGLPRGSFPRDATSVTGEEERRRKKGLRTAGDVGRTMRMLEKTNNKNGGVTPSDIDQAERDRVSYLDAEAKKKAIVGRASHDGAVVGIAIDSLNKTLVTAGADSKLVLWNFVTHMPHKKSPIMLPSPATKLTHVRDSDLAAIAMHDFGVAVFDCSSLTIVRYFGGSRYNKSLEGLGRMSHTCPISDLQFGPDGRKLFTSSLDGTVRVWDVPTGMCVDWMSFSSPPTSLALSPTGEFLATSHVGRLGISLWCDKSFFRMVLLDGTPNEPAMMNEPCPVAECEQEAASDAMVTSAVPSILAKKYDMMAFDDTNGEDENDGSPPQAKEEGLITLSGLPPAHWKNLFHLELVKERNKPTEAPQKPPSAPFFLQWRDGLESSNGQGAKDDTNEGVTSTDATTKSKDAATDGWDAVWSDDDAEDNANAGNSNGSEEGKPSQESFDKPPKRKKVVHHRSKLAELLQNCFDAKEVASIGEAYTDVTSYLSKMGPSSIDVEISSLCYGIHDLDGGLQLLHIASMWLLEACESHSSFEAINAYLHRFLHVHGNVITRMDLAVQKKETELTSDDFMEEEDPQTMKLKDFVRTIAQLQKKQKEASNRLQGKMQHSICLLRHLSRMV